MRVRRFAEHLRVPRLQVADRHAAQRRQFFPDVQVHFSSPWFEVSEPLTRVDTEHGFAGTSRPWGGKSVKFVSGGRAARSCKRTTAAAKSRRFRGNARRAIGTASSRSRSWGFSKESVARRAAGGRLREESRGLTPLTTGRRVRVVGKSTRSGWEIARRPARKIEQAARFAKLSGLGIIYRINDRKVLCRVRNPRRTSVRSTWPDPPPGSAGTAELLAVVSLGARGRP